MCKVMFISLKHGVQWMERELDILYLPKAVCFVILI